MFDEFSLIQDTARLFSVWVYGGVMMAWTAVCCLIMFWRYVPSD
ncbi:MAG: hypothetical protein R2839_07125 [Thermomicrobiales bacterium]